MRKGFYISSERWWFLGHHERSLIEDIIIGDYDEEGGTFGEFNVEFYDFAPLYPHLSIFADAFDAFEQMEEFRNFLFAKENREISRDDFIQGLKNLGYVDLTERERPNE